MCRLAKLTRIYSCANWHFCLAVCARMQICINKFSIFCCFRTVGAGGEVDKPERRKWPAALQRHGRPPCFSHQHWPEPQAGSAVTCDDGEGRNGNYLSECKPHFATFWRSWDSRSVSTGHIPPRPRGIPPWWTWTKPQGFPATWVRSESGPNRTRLQFHKDLHAYFTEISQDARLLWPASSGLPLSTRISVCRAGAQAAVPRTPLWNNTVSV